MAAPEDKYHDAMNTVLAPVRWAKSLVQTALLLAIAIGIGLAYPLILYFNGEPVTLGAFVVSFLTALGIFTLFYAPHYLVFGGIGGTLLFAYLLDIPAFENAAEGISFKWLIFGFLVIGILQRYIRHRLFDPPKEPKPSSGHFGSQLNQVGSERRSREYDAMSAKQREAMIRWYGENYLAWPDLDSPEASEVVSNFDRQNSTAEPKTNGTSAAAPETSPNCGGDLSEHYATLGIQEDASPEEVKQAYRDLAKVWHPDRFDVGDTRLRQRAEEQLKAINNAYAHIEEAQLLQSETAIERIPLEQAILETNLFISTITAKMMQVMMFPGFKTEEEVTAAARDCSPLCKEGITRLKAAIGRIKREDPGSSVEGLERALARLMKQQARLEGYTAATALRAKSS